MRLDRKTANFLRKNEVEKRIKRRGLVYFFKSKEYADFLK